MKIGFFTPHPLSYNGGIESVSHGIVHALTKRGHDVRVHTVKELPQSPPYRIFRGLVRWTPYSSIVDSLKLARSIRKESFDVVISNDIYGFFAEAPRKICLMHGYYGDVYDSIRHKISPIRYQWGRELARIQRAAIRRADVTVVPSTHSQNCFAKDGVIINEVIPHGIDMEKFKPTKSTLDLPKNFLVHVASKAPWKNFEMIQRLSRTHSLVCVSKSTPGNPGIRFVQGLSTQELAGLYSEAEAMVHPAYHEGFGLVGCEAMACGTPAVVTNTGYGPDIARDFPELVVSNPQSLEEFEEKIAYARENRKMLSTKVRRFIATHNNYSAWEKKWVSLVEEK